VALSKDRDEKRVASDAASDLADKLLDKCPMFAIMSRMGFGELEEAQTANGKEATVRSKC
jgi:hypothetical protein